MKKSILFLILAYTIVGCSKKAPVIGLSGWRCQTIEAIIDSVGGVYKYLAYKTDSSELVYITDSAEIDSMLDELDGIIFLGGEDVNPKLYGEEPYPCGSTGWNDQRDSSEMQMIRMTIKKDIPMLGICRGSQAMNVALGGALIQDIGVYLGKTAKKEDITAVIDSVHNRVISKGVSHTGRHDLIVNPDSKWLYHIAQDSTLNIVTGHHESVDPKRLAPGITIAAITADSIVEAIEYKSNTFALGIQGHPEHNFDALKRPQLKRIFEVFLDHCK